MSCSTGVLLITPTHGKIRIRVKLFIKTTEGKEKKSGTLRSAHQDCSREAVEKSGLSRLVVFLCSGSFERKQELWSFYTGGCYRQFKGKYYQLEQYKVHK